MFFKKIRRRLLADNKIRKYLAYAFGEVLIVVFGILIALSLNNWNQDREAKTIEIKTLKDLKSDLVKNLKEIEDYHVFTTNRYEASLNILKYLDLPLAVDDTLMLSVETLYNNDRCNIWSTTYKSIENQGLIFMHNDSLRVQITEMYDRLFQNIIKRENLDYESVNNYLKPMIFELFQGSDELRNSYPEYESKLVNMPLDYEKLRENNKFKNIVIDLHYLIIKRLHYQKVTLIELELLISNVQKEIDHLSR